MLGGWFVFVFGVPFILYVLAGAVVVNRVVSLPSHWGENRRALALLGWPAVAAWLWWEGVRATPTADVQLLVLGQLVDGEKAGRHIREGLARQGVRKSAPAFYLMMDRLEGDGLVVGRYGPVVVNGQTLGERRYEVTGEGARVWTEARAGAVPVASGEERA